MRMILNVHKYRRSQLPEAAPHTNIALHTQRNTPSYTTNHSYESSLKSTSSSYGRSSVTHVDDRSGAISVEANLSAREAESYVTDTSNSHTSSSVTYSSHSYEDSTHTGRSS